MACIDPSGNATTGILRRQTNKASFSDNDDIKFTSKGGEDAWPTSRYLNMWVSALSSSLLGYAQFPWDYNSKPNTDGVVIGTTAFGRVGNVVAPYHQGRTATHEIGHWLALIHISGDDNGACSGTDNCNDTPNQGGQNGACPPFPRVSCSNGPNGDMFMNYMDYTDDPCMNTFTTDQRIRMRSVFSSGGVRESIVNTAFSIAPQSAAICGSGTVRVSNIICLSPINWTILSGNATITGGQGTNAVTVQTTGNGTFRISASTAGYIDEKDIFHGAPPYGVITPYLNYCLGGSDWELGLQASSPDPTVTEYLWSRDGVSVGGGSTYATYEFPPSCMIIGLKAGNACGFSPEGTQQFCPPCPYRMAIGPNPAKGQLIVSFDKVFLLKHKTDKNNIVFRLIKIGNLEVVRQWSFKSIQPTYSLQLNNIKQGVYTLEMVIGKERESRQVIVVE